MSDSEVHASNQHPILQGSWPGEILPGCLAMSGDTFIVTAGGK